MIDRNKDLKASLFPDRVNELWRFPACWQWYVTLPGLLAMVCDARWSRSQESLDVPQSGRRSSELLRLKTDRKQSLLRIEANHRCISPLHYVEEISNVQTDE